MAKIHDRGGWPNDDPIDRTEHQMEEWERRVDSLNSILGERGLVALFQVSREHTQLRQIIETLHEENNRLHRYVQALTIEPRFLENEARRELGMIKPGEQLFLIKTIPQAPVTPPTRPAPSSQTAAN